MGYKSQGQAPNNVRRLASLGFARTRIMSAKGAEYKSQGQAPNNVRRLAPGSEHNDNEALKERNNSCGYFALSVLCSNCFPRYQGRRVPLRFTLALAIIFRAFGAAVT